MPDTTTDQPSDNELAIMLVEAYVASAGGSPALPPGMRDRVIALLYGLFADRERLARYADLLEAELRRRGALTRLLRGPCWDFPDEQAARDGFDRLPDEALAAMALDPAALRGFEAYLDDPESRPGRWFVDGVIAAEAARPDDPERRRAAREVYQHLRDAGLMRVEPADAGLLVKRPAVRWAARITALAASLILGLFLGRALFQGGPPRPPALLASATLSYEGARGGAERIPEITVESSDRGFVSVLAVPPGPPARPFVLPVAPDEDLPVGRGGDPASIRLPEPMRRGGAALVIVTRTPAADTLDKALFEARFSAEELDRLKARVRDILRAKGHERFAIAEIVIDPPEQ